MVHCSTEDKEGSKTNLCSRFILSDQPNQLRQSLFRLLRKMSSTIHDENTDHSQISFNSQMDSGYFSFTSPCRLSPSSVIYTQHDSPLSESDLSSPVHRSTQNFLSNVDYENYVSTRKYFDILTQLDHRNAGHLIDQILRYFSSKDISSCSLVCKKWNLINKDFTRRLQTKNVKRNLFQNTSQFTSTPMQMINNRMAMKMNNTPVQEQMKDENIHLTASSMTFRYGYLKYLHGPTITKRCPLCSFVSIVDVNDQRG